MLNEFKNQAKENLESIIVLTDFTLCCNKEEVFVHMNCSNTSPSFEQVEETYEMLEKQIYELIKPVASLKFANGVDNLQSKEVTANDSVIYCFTSLGKKVSELSNLYFGQGDYLAGMMADLMSDFLLFQMDGIVLEALKKECSKRKKGILKRLEAPIDVPMEAQKIILSVVSNPLIEHCLVTDGYMYSPVKSSGYIFLLTDDETVFKGKHNCKTCSASNNCAFCKKSEDER